MSAPSPVQQALCAALDDEYRRRAVHAAMIDRFGPVRDFVGTLRADQRRITALYELLRRRGWDVPGDPHAGHVVLPSSLTDILAMALRPDVERYRLLRDLAAGDAEALAVLDVVCEDA